MVVVHSARKAAGVQLVSLVLPTPNLDAKGYFVSRMPHHLYSLLSRDGSLG